MLGRIRTNDRCPECGGAFKETVINQRGERDLVCHRCRTRPRRYYVDARGFRDRGGKVGKVFKDRRGKPFSSYEAALRFLNAMRQEVDEGRFDSTRWSPDRRKEMVLSAACLPWLDHIHRNKSEAYHEHQRHFLFRYVIPIMGDLDVREIRGVDVEKLHADLLKTGRAANTIRNILTALRSCLSWLKKMDVIERLPLFPPLSPIPRVHVAWIERDDQDAVIAHARSDVRLLFEIMAETGIRPGEAVALKVRDLRDGGVRIERAMTQRKKIKGTKTNIMSWKVLSDDLYTRLVASCRDKLPEAWLFINTAGTPFSPRHLSTIWRTAALAAGKDICLYVATRHSRVNQLHQELKKTVADQLRKQLAHTSARVTSKHYIREKSDDTLGHAIIKGK